MSASHLATVLRDLGEVQAARDLDQDTGLPLPGPGRRPPRDSDLASNLAVCLRDLGEMQAARDLDEDTERRGRRLQEGGRFRGGVSRPPRVHGRSAHSSGGDNLPV